MHPNRSLTTEQTNFSDTSLENWSVNQIKMPSYLGEISLEMQLFQGMN